MIGQRGNDRSGDGGKVLPLDDGEVPRLLDQPQSPSAHGGTSSGWALEVLRAATPYNESENRKQRISAALSAKRISPGPRLWKPLLAGGVLLGFGAVASAAIWHWPQWVANAYERMDRAPAPSAAAAPAAVRAHRFTRLPPSVPAFPDESPAVPVPPSHAPLADSPLPSLTPAHRELTSRVPARRMVGEDTSEVLAAVRALRRDHDPVRARSLLAAYLARHPAGALAEEALAMSIEAAIAHRDADAATLANRYLRVYPSGPFRTLATQALLEPR